MSFTYSHQIIFATREGVSYPNQLKLTVTANDALTPLIYNGIRNRRYRHHARVGEWFIDLSRLGYTAEDVTLETVQATLYVREGGTGRRQLVLVPVAEEVPLKVVIPTNATLGTYSGGALAFDEATPVDSPEPLTAYILKADDHGFIQTISVDDLPASVAINPDTVPSWPEADDSFDMDFTVAAAIDDERIGPESDPVTRTIALTDTYYLDPADWSATSITNEGPIGKIDVAIDSGSGFVLQAPYDELWVHSGPVPTDADSATLLPSDWFSTSDPLVAQISVGATVRIPTGLAEGATAYSVILMRRSDTGRALIISTRKTTTVLALVTSPPTITSSPTFSGLVSHDGVTKADVGVQLTLNPGTASGTVTGYTTVIRINGIAVASPTSNASATYTPVAADIGKTTDGRYTATTAGGTAGKNTEASFPIVDPVPTAVGTISNVAYETGAGVKTGATASAFSGNRLTYSISANALGATIDSTTGEYSIPNQTEAGAATMTVTASNTGGSASLSFTATYTVPADTFTFAPFTAWDVVEVTDDAEGQAEGTLKFSVNSSVVVPSGYQIGAYAVRDALPATAPAMGATMPIGSGGTKYYNKGTFPKGAIVAATTYRIKTATGELRQNNAKTPPITIQGFDVDPNPGGDWIAPPASAISKAQNLSNETFNSSDTSTNAGGFRGPIEVVLAYNSWRSTTAVSTDATVLARVREPLTGNKCPACNSGFSMQFEAANWAAGATLVKNTPRLWNALSSTEKSKVDVLIRALTLSAAWSSSGWRDSKRADNKRQSSWVNETQKMNGQGNNYSLRGNINMRMANPYMVTLHSMFFGSTSATVSFLNSNPFSAIASELSDLGLTNAAGSGRAYDTNRSGKPSISEINTCTTDWQFQGTSASNPVGLFTKLIEACFSKNCFEKHPKAGQSGGPPANRAQLFGYPGSITAELNALHGQVGMPAEMDANDAGGVRSSMTYAWFDLKQAWSWWIMMLTGGLLARNSTAAQSLKGRCDIGFRWFAETGDIGWYDYAKSGEGGGNSDFRFDATRSGQLTRNLYGIDIGLPMWKDVIKPML